MSCERVFIGLGSNLGNRVAYLKEALHRITELFQTKVVRFSSVYETAPIGYLNQQNFLNLVAEISTSLPPEPFLEKIQGIENDLGRVRTVRWGPRTIDIDILYWGDQVISTDALRVPHPETENRRFVLVPLNEIAAEFAAPPKFFKISELLRTVSQEQLVRLHLPKENCEPN